MVIGWLETLLPPSFPGGSVIKQPPADAPDRDLIPWSGKIPHALEQQSLGAVTTEAPVPQSACSVCNRTNQRNEKPVPQNQRVVALPQLQAKNK